MITNEQTKTFKKLALTVEKANAAATAAVAERDAFIQTTLAGEVTAGDIKEIVNLSPGRIYQIAGRGVTAVVVEAEPIKAKRVRRPPAEKPVEVAAEEVSIDENAVALSE